MSSARKIVSYTISPDVIDAVNRAAERAGRNRSNYVETLLCKALAVDSAPSGDKIDVRLAEYSGRRVHCSVYIFPAILRRLNQEARRLNRPLSHVVNRHLLDSLNIPLSEL